MAEILNGKIITSPQDAIRKVSSLLKLLWTSDPFSILDPQRGETEYTRLLNTFRSIVPEICKVHCNFSQHVYCTFGPSVISVYYNRSHKALLS